MPKNSFAVHRSVGWLFIIFIDVSFTHSFIRSLSKYRHNSETLQVQFQTTAIGKYHNHAGHTNVLVS